MSFFATMNADPQIDPERIAQLRLMAREGKTVAEMIAELRVALDPKDNYSIMIVLCFMRAFGLTLMDARYIEALSCMGGGFTDDEVDVILRPLISKSTSAS